MYIFWGRLQAFVTLSWPYIQGWLAKLNLLFNLYSVFLRDAVTKALYRKTSEEMWVQTAVWAEAGLLAWVKGVIDAQCCQCFRKNWPPNFLMNVTYLGQNCLAVQIRDCPEGGGVCVFSRFLGAQLGQTQNFVENKLGIWNLQKSHGCSECPNTWVTQFWAALFVDAPDGWKFEVQMAIKLNLIIST